VLSGEYMTTRSSEMSPWSMLSVALTRVNGNVLGTLIVDHTPFASSLGMASGVLVEGEFDSYSPMSRVNPDSTAKPLPAMPISAWIQSPQLASGPSVTS